MTACLDRLSPGIKHASSLGPGKRGYPGLVCYPPSISHQAELHHSRYHTFLPTKHYQWLHLPSPAGMSLTPPQVRRSAGALITALAPESTAHLPISAGSQAVGVTTLARPVPGPLCLADRQVHTPLRYSEFERESFVITPTKPGLISFTGPHTPYTARNLSSAFQHPEVVSSELQKEVAAGRVLGPFADRPLPNLRTSGLGAAPKKNGKWRVILHPWIKRQ